MALLAARKIEPSPFACVGLDSLSNRGASSKVSSIAFDSRTFQRMIQLSGSGVSVGAAPHSQLLQTICRKELVNLGIVTLSDASGPRSIVTIFPERVARQPSGETVKGDGS